MHNPLSLTIPAIIDVKAGSHGFITITNTGTGRLTITDQVAHLTARSRTYPARLTIGPAHALRPGQSERIAISAPAQAGHTYANIQFTARLATTSGTVHIHGGAASSVEVSGPGTAIAVVPPHGAQTVTPPVVSAEPIAGGAWAAIAVGVVVVVTGVLAAWRIRRHSRRLTGPARLGAPGARIRPAHRKQAPGPDALDRAHWADEYTDDSDGRDDDDTHLLPYGGLHAEPASRRDAIITWRRP